MKENQEISNGGETVILESQYLISKTDQLSARVLIPTGWRKALFLLKGHF